MKLFFSHARFRGPLAVLRRQASGFWRWAFRVAGRYRPLSPEENALEKTGVVTFKGDAPRQIADRGREQGRIAFRHARPVCEIVDNLVVTPSGAGWKEGVLYERYSASRPGLRMLWPRPAPEKSHPAGYFIQSAHRDTFGDWFSEYLATLAYVDRLDAPLFLPAALAGRSYVKRDVKRLGIDAISINKPINIENAKVLRQKLYVRYWTAERVAKLRQFINADPTPPTPGSLLYLSRYGEKSEIADRAHPHELIEREIRRHGGKVLRTSEAAHEDYIAMVPHVETLVMDHGSAGYNMAYWQPKRVIEIVSDAWWINAFLFFADSIGVKDYTIIRSDHGGAVRCAEKLSAALAQPIETGREETRS